MSNLSQKILEEIDKKKIEPQQRWIFLVKKYLLYVVVSLLILFCSLVFALVLIRFFSIDFDLMDKFMKGRFMFFLLSMPYLWLFVLAALLIIAFFVYRNTELGYKRKTIFVIFGLVIMFILLGGVLFFSGVSGALERKMVTNSIYQKMDLPVNKLWSNPEDGFLGGIVLEKKSRKLIILSDLSSQSWEVDLSDAVVKKNVYLMKGEKIKIVGEKVTDGRFKALEVRLWVGCGMQCQMH